mgnify:FL=1
MKIKVASLNPQKIQAVQDTILDYEILREAIVEGISADSGVSDQPKSLEETVSGAINRAKNAFVDCDLSFGIESGLLEVPKTKSGYVDICICAIYDGKEVHVGGSSVFEIPKKIMDLMHGGMNMQDACFEAGLTANKNLGSAEGMIGILTKGRVTRLAYTKQAIISALIHLENKELF